MAAMTPAMTPAMRVRGAWRGGGRRARGAGAGGGGGMSLLVLGGFWCAPARGVASLRPGLAYQLGGKLYLGVTDRCHATPLPATRGPGFRMPPDSGFRRLGDWEPSPGDLAEAVAVHMASGERREAEVVFAGYGEPLLRVGCVVEAMARARDRGQAAGWSAQFRLVTNGLFAPGTAALLARQGLSRATVALARSGQEPSGGG